MKFREEHLTIAIGVLAFVLLTAWSMPMIYPLAWGDLCMAAGLRPPMDMFHGISRCLLSLLFAVLPTKLALLAAGLLGRLTIAAAVAGIYVVFRAFLPYVMNIEIHRLRIVMPICRGIAAMTALLFLSLDPVWRAGQSLTSVTVLVALGVFAMVCFMRFLQGCGQRYLYPCFFAFGALSSDSFVGILLSVAVIFWLKSISRGNVWFSELSDELIWNLLIKRLLKVWLLAFGIGLGIGVVIFVSHGGMKAVDFSGAGGFAPLYQSSLVNAVTSSASLVGWLYGLIICIFPFVMTCVIKQKACGTEELMPYSVAILFVLIAFGALFQLVMKTPLLSWCHINLSESVPSDFLLVVFQTFSLASLSVVTAVFGTELCCRNYRRIIKLWFQDSTDENLPTLVFRSLIRERGLMRMVFFFVLAVIPCLALSSQYRKGDREVAGIIMSYVREIVAECRDRNVVFTEGAFDPLIELCAYEEGVVLNAISMLSPNTPFERVIRTRAVETDEDDALLANDGITALRTWIETGNSNRLARCATLVGSEFWKRQMVSMPPVSGLVILPGEHSLEAIVQGRSAANELSDRVISFCQGYSPEKLDDPWLRRLFPVVQWQLAQNWRLRSYVEALDHRFDESAKATEIAERIDDGNSSLANLNKNIFWKKVQNGGVLTPREALIIGLARADFKLASYFAAPILKTDPDDVRANFAMGMKYYISEEWALSEKYFKRCLKTRPGDPAVLNNLANVQARLGMYAEAEENIDKALDGMPNCQEILNSKSQIKELAAQAQKPKQN